MTLEEIDNEIKQSQQNQEIVDKLTEFLKHRCHGSDVYYGYTLGPILESILKGATN